MSIEVNTAMSIEVNTAPCAGCGKPTTFKGTIVTREGLKPVCSVDCLLEAAAHRPDVCTVGALEDARKAGLS